MVRSIRILTMMRVSVREVSFQGGIGVHIAALVISLICAIFSLFQGGIAMIFGSAGAGLAEFIGEESTEMSLLAGFGVFIFLAAFLGIIGGIFAALRKKAGWILLAIAAAVTLVAGMGMQGGMGTGGNDGFLYAIAYGLASFLAFRSFKGSVATEAQSVVPPPLEVPISTAVPPVFATAAPSTEAHGTSMAQASVWTCSSCMTENAPENRFCFSCGQEKEKPKPVCPHCGKENQPGMKFCPFCGTTLPDQGAIRGFEKGPTNIPFPAVQDSSAISSHPSPVPAVPQSSAPKPTPFPVGAIAVIVLGLGILIAVFFSFSKSQPKVTASQENPPTQTVNQPAPVVQAGVQPDTVLQFPASGWISASNVNMRAGHSILAQRLATLPRGQNVTVLDSWISGSDQEAILKQDLYVEIGGRTKTLGKGRAVSLLQHDPSQGTYLVSLKDKSGTISGWTSETNVKSLKGALWYKVSTSSGKTGWILGEFISINR